MELFQEAVKLDSNYTQALTELSWAHSWLYWMGIDQTSECREKAKHYADLALVSDEEDAYSHVAYGYYYYYCLRDFKRAEKEFEYVLRKMPDDAYVLASLAYIKRRLGQWEESFQMQKKVLQMDPLNYGTRNSLILTAWYMRQFDYLDSLTNEILKLIPDDLNAYFYRVRVYLFRDGNAKKALQSLNEAPESLKPSMRRVYMYVQYFSRKFEDALENAIYSLEIAVDSADTAQYYIDKAIILERLGIKEESQILFDSARQILEPLYHAGRPQGGILLPPLSEVYALLGRHDDAIKMSLAEADRIPIEKDALMGSDVMERLANAYILTGNYDKGIHLLDTLLSIPSKLTVNLLKISPDYDFIRDDPRFQTLIEKYEKKDAV
jgi:tetratricopeptide (TPR) repeat protein